MEHLLDLLGTILNNTVNMLKGVEYPGIGITFFDLYIGIAVIIVSFMILKIIFNVGGSNDRKILSKSKVKISNERKDDTK